MELPESEVQDIDTPTDWALAELKYRMWAATRE
jgi:CMP-N-acetylneuraminic acid synthetase